MNLLEKSRITARNSPCRHDLTPAAESGVSVEPILDRAVYATIHFDAPPKAGRAIDIWIPAKFTRPVALFFVHGGGWKLGHREQMYGIMRGFFEEGYPCVSVCYQTGNATIADQLSDVRHGMALAGARLADHGFDGPFVLYGSSAGGHLALLAGLAAPGVCGDSFSGKSPAVAGIVASCAPVTLEPWEEIFPDSLRCIRNAVGVAYEEDPVIYRTLSPATYASPASPPMLFLLGACEHMFPNEHALDLVRRLRTTGHPSISRVYPNAEHGFFYDLTRKAQRAAFSDVLDFLKDPVGSGPLASAAGCNEAISDRV